MIIDTEEPLAIAVVEAIHTGDVEALRRLLAENAGLANAQLGGDPDNNRDGGMTRSLLHVATDLRQPFEFAVCAVCAVCTRFMMDTVAPVGG